MESRFSLTQEHASMYCGCSAANEATILRELLSMKAPELWTVQEWIDPASDDAELVEQMNGQEWLRLRGHEIRQ